jgi:hypothetical protein
MYKRPQKSRHYAANGRTITACGLTIDRNSFDNEKEHSEDAGQFTCSGCRTVPMMAHAGDVGSLVITSQDGKPDAMERAMETHGRASLLSSRLGPGWKVRVWENCGWHYQVSQNNVTVSEHKYDTAAAYSVQYANTHLIARGSTPEAALKKLKCLLEEEAKEYQEELTNMLSAIGFLR